MSNFPAAVKVILAHEGGWVDDPADLGGETNFGISTLIIEREHITPEFLGLDPATAHTRGWLKPMKVDAAVKVYRQLFWDRFGYEGINDLTAATKVFDAAVNCGPSRAHAMAQRSAGLCGAPCAVDGQLGPESMKAINASDPKRFVRELAGQMRAHYARIIEARPLNAKFERNWMMRAAWGL